MHWLEETFRANAGFVANTLRRLGVRAHDVGDQLQEVFLVVMKLQGVYDSTRPIRPWLFGISYRVAGRYRQAYQRTSAEALEGVTLTDPKPLADDVVANKEAQALVLAALQGVELSRRAVLILADIEGESIPTIADALQIPLNTTYSRLRLAREDFARKLATLKLRDGGRAP